MGNVGRRKHDASMLELVVPELGCGAHSLARGVRDADTCVRAMRQPRIVQGQFQDARPIELTNCRPSLARAERVIRLLRGRQPDRAHACSSAKRCRGVTARED